MSPKQKRVLPRIEVRDNPWGESATVDGAVTPQRDRFYLPGYSDKRQEWELAMTEYRRGLRSDPPKPLERRFQWVSVKAPNGTDRGEKFQEFTSMGYRPVAWDDAEGLKLDLASTAVQKGPDGNVYQGSQMLMVADRATAARNAAVVAETAQAQQDAILDRANDAAAQFNRRLGLSSRGGTAFEFVNEGDKTD